MDELKALLLLNATGVLTAKLLLGSPLRPEEVIREGQKLWKRMGFPERVINFLDMAIKDGWAEREIERCNVLGIKLITWGSNEYPAPLRDLGDAPLLLYASGTKLPSGGIGVVGTRRCSAYGRKVAALIGEVIGSSGIGVVSGGALGIDAAAHEGCLDSGGMTVAVLGTGVDVVYPSSHRWLFEKIKEKGALISEYPLGTKARPWAFPRRNRIISGLSDRLVIVEAPLKSGAMITAKIALELGREVWAVPGRITEENSRGTNALIADGAHVLYDVEAFRETFREHQLLFEGMDVVVSRERTLTNFSKKQIKIYEFLCKYGEQTVDNIAGGCKMSAAEVLQELGFLSLEGMVFPSGPGRWSASPRGLMAEKR